MEALAETTDLAAEFSTWLDDETNYDPIWDSDDAAWARLRLARRVGGDEKCAAILHELFYHLRDESPEEARQVAELFTSWRLDAGRTEALLAAMPELPDEELGDPGTEGRLQAGEAVTLLFVGGNETQARNDQRVRDTLSADWPGVTVQFEHTGWSPNWSREVSHLLRDANSADAVVLMRMMRTQLGRTLRAQIKVPWVACTGTGRDAMLASIRMAARVTLRLRSESVAP